MADPNAATDEPVLRRRSWWGWGWEDQALSPHQVDSLAAAVAARLGVADLEIRRPADLADIELRSPRVQAPTAIAAICSIDPWERAAHTFGKSYRDVVRGFHGKLSEPPDLVAFPATEADVVALLDWCSEEDVAAVPFGGGSSVVGGVEAGLAGAGRKGVVSIDLTRLSRVVEVDRVSRAARVEAGALGPTLEDQLRPHGLTLRHFPQSFEFSTLGGWLATRSGGHYASVYTHIDDLVESVRTVTPAGLLESRRLPGSGAGPSPDRLLLGSEGTLGVITEAWMRVQERPRFKASTGVHFPDMVAGAEATRAIAQAGLFPTNCRLIDGAEAALSAGSGSLDALLVLGFESADHPVGPWLDRALELCRDHGGSTPDAPKISDSSHRGDGRDETRGPVESWRNSFLRAPYTRDALVRMGVLAETFETACTWDAFPALHAQVTSAVEDGLRHLCGGGWVTCRFTHVYPDGCAPYFSVFGRTRFGSELTMWAELKALASEAVLAGGGTITHHHAVGRDHRPWYDRQRPDLFAATLRAAKRELDPAGILNPGVLVDPDRRTARADRRST